MNTQDSAPSSHEQRVYSITQADLPLSCPMPNTRLWDSHPKVYLPISKTRRITCPYCDATYHLIASNLPEKQ